MYSRFWAGDDGVPRPSGTEPVKEMGKNQQYTVHIHMQHISIFTLTMVSRWIKHLLKSIFAGTYTQFWPRKGCFGASFFINVACLSVWYMERKKVCIGKFNITCISFSFILFNETFLPCYFICNLAPTKYITIWNNKWYLNLMSTRYKQKQCS